MMAYLKEHAVKLRWMGNASGAYKRAALLIPQYNEAKHGDFLERLFYFRDLARMHQETLDIILIDDGSSDDSLEKMKNFQLLHPNSLPVVTPSELAYVIYTSGTTGKPKGVMIPHSALNNFIRSMQTLLAANEQMIMLALTTYSFDISCLEFYLPLTIGGRVEVATKTMLDDPALLIAAINAIKPTHMQTTPSRWQQLLDAGWRNESEVQILCGGEPITARLKEELTSLSTVPVWNLYGPTETTIWSAAAPLSREDVITVGKPIANTRLYMLDRHLSLLAPGASGDLYISGAGLAKGYFNQETLTNEKFVENPFQTAGHEKIYKTGDVGSWQETGTVRLGGRSDNQVKIRGYRVELGEIEGRLTAHPLIKEAAVIAVQKEAGNILVAYYVGSEKLIHADIRAFLKELLPEYMLPAAYQRMDKLPLNGSGKIDRRALPEVATEQADVMEEFSPLEMQLADIWAGVLGITGDKISPTGNFFELGGHSLNATIMVKKIFNTMGVRLSIPDFLSRPTIREMSAYISSKQEKANRSVTV